jgi:hypothetical protein
MPAAELRLKSPTTTDEDTTPTAIKAAAMPHTTKPRTIPTPTRISATTRNTKPKRAVVCEVLLKRGRVQLRLVGLGVKFNGRVS